MHVDYRLATLLKIPLENIQDWSGDVELAMALFRQHFRGVYLKVQIGATIVAWVTPSPDTVIGDLPREGLTVPDAMCEAMADWLELKAKFGAPPGTE